MVDGGIYQLRRTSRPVSKTVWEHDFAPDMSDWEKLESVFSSFGFNGPSIITRRANNNLLEPGADYYGWDEVIDAGRSYMVGSDTPLKEYLRSHTSYLTRNSWLAMAVEYAFAHPSYKVVAESFSGQPRHYEVYKRGEFVEIALPHHGKGGERHWAVHPSSPRKRVLINVD